MGRNFIFFFFFFFTTIELSEEQMRMGAFAAQSHRDNKYASNKRPIRRGFQEGRPIIIYALWRTHRNKILRVLCLCVCVFLISPP